MMMKTTAFLTLALSSCLALSAEPEVAKTNESRTEVSKSSSSSSGSTTTTSIDGKTVTITRQTGPDGVEHVTITTFSRSGKPKVVEMTSDEFAEKYGPRKKKEPKADAKQEEKKPEDKPAPAPEPAPSNPGKATE